MKRMVISQKLREFGRWKYCCFWVEWYRFYSWSETWLRTVKSDLWSLNQWLLKVILSSVIQKNDREYYTKCRFLGSESVPLNLTFYTGRCKLLTLRNVHCIIFFILICLRETKMGRYLPSTSSLSKMASSAITRPSWGQEVETHCRSPSGVAGTSRNLSFYSISINFMKCSNILTHIGKFIFTNICWRGFR